MARTRYLPDWKITLSNDLNKREKERNARKVFLIQEAVLMKAKFTGLKDRTQLEWEQ